MLGIIIGVGAVIAMVALGQGAQEQVQQQIAALGSNMLFVMSGNMNRGGVRLGMGNTQTLVMDDVQAIVRECPAVAMAAPGSGTGVQAVFGNDNWGTQATGTEPQYFDIRDWPMQEGVSFTQEDVQLAANVVVIGETVRKNLFGANDPLAQTIRINNLPFKVVGVLIRKGTSAMGSDQDDIMLCPWTTVKMVLQGSAFHNIDQLLVSAVSANEARADVVLLTTSTTIAARLVEWPSSFRERLASWRYRAAVVLLMELRRPFSQTYWVNVADMNAPFLGLVEHTNLVPAERYPARYLYVSNYVAPDDPLARMSTDELTRHYVSALRQMNPRFREGDVQRVWSFREDAAQPVPEIGNRHRLLPFETPIPSVFLANTTQIYPEDRGTNYSVRLGREVATRIADLGSGR